MELINIGEAQKVTSPNPVALVCTKMPNGSTNLATISWWTYLSNRPAMLGLSLSDKGYSGQLIQKNERFTLCVPGEAIADSAFLCGTVSGRSFDKAVEFGLEMCWLDGASTQVPVHSRLVFYCALEGCTKAGDHTFYICKVNSVLYNDTEKQLFAWEGYSSLRPL